MHKKQSVILSEDRMYNWSIRKRRFASAKAAGLFMKNYPGNLCAIGFEGSLLVLHFKLPF